jgi:hypothetical protein
MTPELAAVPNKGAQTSDRPHDMTQLLPDKLANSTRATHWPPLTSSESKRDHALLRDAQLTTVSMLNLKG